MGSGRRELWPLTKVTDGEGEEGVHTCRCVFK